MTAAPAPAGIGRLAVAGGILAAGLVLVALDLAASRPVSPFDAPLPAALGSGASVEAAHCAAPPAN